MFNNLLNKLILLNYIQLVAQFSGSLFPVLKQLSLYSEHEFTSRHAAMICASILNKLPQEGVYFISVDAVIHNVMLTGCM